MLPLAPLVAIAMPAHAQLGGPAGCASCVATDPVGLADTAEPGSVLVFPRFAQGTATLDNGAIEPNTQIEIAAVCPAPTPPTFTGATTSPQTCTPVNYEVEVHWVCPGATVGQQNSVCQENSFEVFVSTYGKVVFNPNGLSGTPITANGRITGVGALNSVSPAPQAPCARGYAIAYVVNALLQPLANNVLIGDAVQRNNLGSGTNNDLQSYSALAIQAAPNTNTPNPGDTGPLINTGTDPITGSATLPFDGQPNDYQMVTGQFYGDVRYNQDSPPGPFADTALILLTLDVRSNLPNDTTTVLLDFYNQNEVVLDDVAASFDCWEQIQLTALDPNLTNTSMGTPNGVVVSGQAVNSSPLNQPSGFRTLLGLIQTSEGPTGGAPAGIRTYTVRPSNNSIPVPTFFTYN
ncbi:MAG TPA: hypothetical protein VJX94_17225 [Stellaceae bacterium]|nr:hypothetical protein [Stellaceae bacterium]